MADNVGGCPFCELNVVDVVAASEFAIAFRDRYPLAEHHTLVIPRRHVASLFELDANELADVWALVADVRWSLAKEFGIEAFNVGLNDGVAAGQTVLHAHVHMIPRTNGDSDDPRGGIRWVIADKARYW